MSTPHPRPGTEWVRRARPFFTTLGVSLPWARATIERRVMAAAEDGCDTIMAFVQDEGYALWPSSVAPTAPRAAGQDLVAAWVEAAHGAGLRFVAQWMGVHVQTVTSARHPGWLQRDRAGTPSTVMCLNGPFAAHLLAQVHEVVSGYPVDGVYMDGLYARQGGCACDACRASFEVLVERPLTSDGKAAAPGAEGGHWLDRWDTGTGEDPDLAAFRFDTVTGFVSRLSRTIREARPDAALILDTLGPQAGSWPNGHDLRRLRESVDVFALECYPDQVHEPLWHASMESALTIAEGRRPIWALRWIARDPDGDLVPVPSATLEAHTATTIVRGTQPTIVEMGLYGVDTSLRPCVARCVDAARRWTGQVADATPVTWAGVLAHRGLHHRASAAGFSRRALDPLAGVWMSLTEAHLPVMMVTDEDLAGAVLDTLDVLFVPDVGALSAPEVDRIIAAVEGGMGLVATGRSLTGRLGERLGIRVEGATVRAGSIGPESAGGGELVNYLRFLDHPITEGIGVDLASYPGYHLRMTECPGDRLGWILDPDLAAMDGERWFGWLPGREAWPLGTALRVGKGRVVSWAAPLDTVAFRQGRPEMGAILASSARWAARRAPTLGLEAPITVEATAWRTDDALLVAVANRATNDLAALGPGIRVGASTSSMSGAAAGETTLRAHFPRVILPAVDVRVTLPWQDALPSVETLTGQPVDVGIVDGQLHVGVRRVDAWEGLRIPLAD